MGAVIFVHELGHFLVAKACGVKVEKFMIGFDIGGYKLSWRRGETEYGIGILPLGGYVKMLGQDDDPAHIAEQMQKSQVDARQLRRRADHGPERRKVLRRSPQLPGQERAAADGDHFGRRDHERDLRVHLRRDRLWHGRAVLAVHRFGNVPGSPAWQAGFEPGDEIVQIGDHVESRRSCSSGGVTLGDLENGIRATCVARPMAEIVARQLKPQQDGRVGDDRHRRRR